MNLSIIRLEICLDIDILWKWWFSSCHTLILLRNQPSQWDSLNEMYNFHEDEHGIPLLQVAAIFITVFFTERVTSRKPPLPHPVMRGKRFDDLQIYNRTKLDVYSRGGKNIAR